MSLHATFARNLVKNRARRYVQDFCNALGVERFRYMITHNIPMKSIISADQQAHLALVAQQYKWVADAISDKELIEMLPANILLLVHETGKDGSVWIADLVLWLRGFFVEKR